MLSRFVAFAFSAADTLLETDRSGKITFAEGALSAFIPRVETLAGHPLAALFDNASRPAVNALLTRSAPDRRLGPVDVRIDGDTRSLCGWMHQGTDRIAWTLSAPRAGRSPQDSRRKFENGASDLIEQRRTTGAPTRFGFIQVDGNFDNADRDSQREFFRTIDTLAALTACEGAGGRVGERTLMVVTETEDDVVELGSAIFDIAPGAGLKDPSIEQRVFADDPGLDGDSVVEALQNIAARIDETGEMPAEGELVDAARAIAEERNRRLAALSTVIRGRRFEPHAQVVVDALTGEESYYELFARLPGGAAFESGVLFAEEHGIAPQLDLAMLDYAVEFLENSADRPALAVNLSGRTIGDIRAAGALVQRLKDVRIDRRRLGFEITETAAISDFSAARRCVEKLRAWGCSVALDDFGAGACGMSYLQNLPVDAVKIDGALLEKTEESERGKRVFAAVLRMLQALKVRTVVERIETEEQAVLARRCKADCLQGWLFGESMPLSTLMEIHKPENKKVSGFA